VEERMIRAINSIGGKSKLDSSFYSKSLNPEELIDWIEEMKKFFEFE